MVAKIGIEEAEFFAYHGYYTEERKGGHVFQVTAFVEIGYSTLLDQTIINTVNYEGIYNICKEEMENTQMLLETVAANILNRFKMEFVCIHTGCVKIVKLSPQLGGKVKASVVELRL